MILGIGTDICDIARIAGTLEAQGRRFIDRCFDVRESAYADQAGENRAQAYAKRWAAKEACAKALGLGIRDDIYLKDIVVINDDMGKPAITLQGGAKERLTRITPSGMTAKVDISLSDDAGMALAFVVISAVLE